MITLTELTVFAIYLLNLYNQRTEEPAVQFMTVMLFILTVFLIPNRWKNCLLAACVVWISYIVFCTIVSDPSVSPPLIQRGIYLGVCLVFCAIFIFGRESSQRKHFAAEKLLEFVSITDMLTGIYNRNRFEYVLSLWIKNNRHNPFCLIFFDIDDFKKANDTFGHNAGDQVLRRIAEVVSSSIRDNDIFARWGGEEFVVLFESVDLELAVKLAERLRKAVETYPFDKPEKVTISIGAVEYRKGESMSDFIDRADQKMYEAKRAGKNQVVFESKP
jgi:diguanylate cyclase (GGDEF)-like protein